jgi:CheY-like chemotaxis protein
LTPKILVVDEDLDFIEINRLILVKDGYEVITARDGEEALEKMRTDRPDLILLEIMRSNILDRAALSQTWEKDPEWGNIPLIMVSTLASFDYAKAFLAGKHLHVDKWLPKPISPEELLTAVARFVNE